jgi:hypothetical protein
MSAAATAAGYLYASGRLRGRAQREQEEAQKTAPQPQSQQPQRESPRPRAERPKVAPVRKEVRVAALPQEEPKPRRTPTIQYRTRRWKPDAA